MKYLKNIFVFLAMVLLGTASMAQSKSAIAVPAPKAINLGDNADWIPLFVQGIITTNFAQYSGLKVIDRQNVDMVKAEQKLSESAEYSDTDVVEMGKLTNAKLIITGSITGKSNSYALVFSITDTETGETKASANVPNCLMSALESGEAANKISYDLMKNYGIKLSADTETKLLKSASVMTSEVEAQASLAKGIVAENKGTNIEALTYYIQAKKNDKKLGEATSRMANMTTVVTSGNFGANAKNMMKLRNDWDKLFKEAAQLLASNEPEFVLKYFSDIEPLELTESDYENGTMSFKVSFPYMRHENGAENAQIISNLLNTLHVIPESKNWGEKINGFPWTYADDTKGDNWLKKTAADKWEDYKFEVSLLDAKKKSIKKEIVTYSVEYDKNYYSLLIEPYNLWYSDDEYNGTPSLKISEASVSDADTDKLYIEVKQISGSKKTSIMPVSSDVLPYKKAYEVIKSGNYVDVVKIGGYIRSSFGIYIDDSVGHNFTLDLSELCKKNRYGYEIFASDFATGSKYITKIILPIDLDTIGLNKSFEYWGDFIYSDEYKHEFDKTYHDKCNFGSTNITDLVLPFGLQYLDFGSFNSKLSSITIPSTVTNIVTTDWSWKGAAKLTINYYGSKEQFDRIVESSRSKFKESYLKDYIDKNGIEVNYNVDPVKYEQELIAKEKAEKENRVAEEERRRKEEERLKKEEEARLAAEKAEREMIARFKEYSKTGVPATELANYLIYIGKLYYRKPDSVKVTGNLSGSELRNIFSKSSVRKELSSYAFSLDLSEVSGLTEIESGTFKSNITAITLPSSLTKIEADSFYIFPEVFFTGSKKQWKKVVIEDNLIKKAKVQCLGK